MDKVVNQIGRELIDTLQALDICILNGRFDRSKDNYTSVSSKGLAVVDYILTPYSTLTSFKNFQVHDILEIINSNGIPIDSAIPDHRLLTVEYCPGTPSKDKCVEHHRKPSKDTSIEQAVKVKRAPSGYMQNNVAINQLRILADQMSLQNQHVDINSVYDSFCNIVDAQLEVKTLNPKKTSDRENPWWDEHLKAMAKRVRLSLKAWEQNKGNGELKLAYMSNQKEFSKLVRKSKRRFRRGRQLKLLQQQKYKPKAFWHFVKGIGSTAQQLPNTVRTTDGEMVTETNDVLSEWKDYFCSLLNPQNPGHKAPHPIESLNLDASELNENFSYEEVKAAVLSNDNNKSPGYDQIKPLYIKNEACIHFLLPLFNYCFHHGVVPDDWFKTIIKPIPKSNPTSQSPSDYRGISLQSLVAKTFSRLLNTRLREWLEYHDALSDEQNGFRTDRSARTISLHSHLQ